MSEKRLKLVRIPLANLLVRSPLPQFTQLLDAVQRTADCVPELLSLLVAQDYRGLERMAREVSNLEAMADASKNELRSRMPVRLMLPVDRRDVLRLISELDAIADCAEDVGVILTLRRFEVPPPLVEPLQDFIHDVMAVVRAASDLVRMTDELISASFSGKAAERAISQVKEIGRLEHLADKRQDQCAKVLFRSEDELSPVAIFMWTKLLNKIGDIANHAENVGDQFRLFVAAS